MIKKAWPPSGDQAPDLHLLGSGAGFEPALPPWERGPVGGQQQQQL